MSWKDELPEDIRDSEMLRDTPDVATLAKRFLDTQKEVSRRIPIPGEDAGEDAMRAFREQLKKVDGVVDVNDEGLWQRLGAPDDPDGYSLPEMPEGVHISDERLKNLKQVAHGAGITKKQWETLMGADIDFAASKFDQQNQNLLKLNENLKKEWGGAYEAKSVSLDIAAKHYGMEPEAVQAIKQSGNLPLMNMLADIGQSFIEDNNIDIETVSTGRAPTPKEAARRLAEIRSNPKHPYNNRRDPGHSAAIDEVNMLTNYKLGGRRAG